METMPTLLAYFSPETYLPVTSIIATAIGVIMMFGRNTLKFMLGCVRMLKRREPKATSLRGPHFRPADPARDATESATADES